MTYRMLLLSGSTIFLMAQAPTGTTSTTIDPVTASHEAVAAQLQSTVLLKSAADSLSKAVDALQKSTQAVIDLPPAPKPSTNPTPGSPPTPVVITSPPASTTIVTNPPLTPIWQSIIDELFKAVEAIVATSLTALVAIYGPRLTASLEKKTQIQFTDSERASMMTGMSVAAGTAQTMLKQGLLQLHEVVATNPKIIQLATDAINRQPGVAQFLDKSIPSASQTIVGLIDTKSHPTPTPTPNIGDLVAPTFQPTNNSPIVLEPKVPVIPPRPQPIDPSTVVA
jgi:hypothetical protein